MSNSKEEFDVFLTKEHFEKIPVTYCKSCLSLKIRILDDDIDYCDDCGSTDVETTDIETWNEMYLKKYNKTFLKD